MTSDIVPFVLGSLSMMMLATPVFGWALTPPDPDLMPPAAMIANVDVAALGETSPVALGVADGLPALQSGGGDMKAYAETMRQRAELADVHRVLGTATWISMGITLLLGGIQYHNLYGQFAGEDDNPCVTGDAIFGQGQCYGTPVLHLTSAVLTTALYTATFALSGLMPDPGGLDEGDSDFASNLRLHKLLRWIHFGGMIAQLALGLVIANGESFGLDRANDYSTLRTLSTVHLGLGLVTYGALTWAAALMW